MKIQKIQLNKKARVIIDGREYNFQVENFKAFNWQEGQDLEKEELDACLKRKKYFNSFALNQSLKEKGFEFL